MKSIKTKWGGIEYRNERGELHREDGPAIEHIDGYKSWWINGLRHREDGPAVIWSDGDVKYWSDGDVEYWLNDIKYSEQEFNNHLLRKRLQRILEL